MIILASIKAYYLQFVVSQLPNCSSPFMTRTIIRLRSRSQRAGEEITRPRRHFVPNNVQADKRIKAAAPQFSSIKSHSADHKQAWWPRASRPASNQSDWTPILARYEQLSIAKIIIIKYTRTTYTAAGVLHTLHKKSTGLWRCVT